MKAMKRVHGIFATIGLLAVAGFTQEEDYATWGKSRPVVINTSATGAAISDTLYNFPLLLRLDSTHAEMFAQAKSGGADLRFRAFPGDPLAYYIDHWDSAARKAEIWVSVDRILPGSATQEIHMLWQKPDAPAASNGAGVFDSAKGFTAAWHMGGPAGNRPNSTPGGVDAVPGTTDSLATFSGRSVAGVVGTADSLAGGTATTGGEYFDVSPMPGFGVGFTFSFWANVSSLTDRTWMRFFDFGNGEASDNLFAGRQAATSDVIWDVFPSQSVLGTSALVTDQWKHYVMTVSLQTGMSYLYVDGVQVGEIWASYNETDRASSYLGRSNWADAFFTGKMDEVHVSWVSRPAGWAKLSYETQKPGANSVLTFGTVGAPVAVAPRASASPAARALRVAAQGSGHVFSIPAPAASDLRVSVLDVQGRAVWSSVLPRGATSIAWSGVDAHGRVAPHGMYVARIAGAADAGSPREARFLRAR